MSDLPRPYWQDMRSADFAPVDPERWVALLPVGAVEQHGPHLPLRIDACITQDLAAGMPELKPASLPAGGLPMSWVGRRKESVAFSGTFIHSAEPLQRMWSDIDASLRSAGLRKLVIRDSQGGPFQVM